MGLFSKFFKSKPVKTGHSPKSNDRGKYMPEIKLPLDEKFTINFKGNGGKFLYCENTNEVHSYLNQIIKENNWQKKNGFIFDITLIKKLKNTGINTTNKISEASYFVTTCENLIANDGSLLISSNQIAEKKLIELPDNFIVFATTSQITDNIGEGLRGIKAKNKNKIPTNITTIKNFKTVDEKDFLNYGSSSKNLYLLLLEDL